MSEEARTTGLGRGLSALLGDEGDDYAALDRVRGAREVPVEQVRPNPRQPRQNFDADELAALAQSIGSRGILQPILVRRVPGEGDAYEISGRRTALAGGPASPASPSAGGDSRHRRRRGARNRPDRKFAAPRPLGAG